MKEDSKIIKGPQQTANLWLLTGPIHSGKTTFLLKMHEFLTKKGFACGGLLSPACFINERRIGYNGLDLRTGKTFPLARTKGLASWQKAGRFYFDPEGLVKAKTAVRGFFPADLTVVDEIGHLELRRCGLWNELLSLLKQPQIKWFVVRESLTNRFLERFGRETPVLRFSDAELFPKLESLMGDPPLSRR